MIMWVFSRVFGERGGIKPNRICIGLNRQQALLASVWTQIKQFVYFKQDGGISALNNIPLKLVDHFSYFGNNISSTESDFNISTEKLQFVINQLSTTKRSDLYDKIKQEFFKIVAMLVLSYGYTTRSLTGCQE